MATANLVAWLSSVQGLAPEAQTQAQQLFEKHQIDKAFLDFIVSENGTLVIEAHRRGVEADAEAEPEAEAMEEPAAAVEMQRGKLCGRQKINLQSNAPGEQHYFGRHHVAKEPRAPRTRASDNTTSYPSEPRIPSRSSTKANGQVEPNSTPGHIKAVIAAPTATAASSPAAQPLPSPPQADTTPKLPVGSPVRQGSTAAASDGTPPRTPSSNEAREVEGVLKSFNDATGYGFISSAQVGQDIFLQGSQLPDGICRDPGWRLRCTLFYDAKGRPQARDLVWLEPNAPAEVPSNRFVGILKSMGDTYGFIECAETFQQYGRDVFVQRMQLFQGWQLQQPIEFEITVSPQGKPQAKEVWSVTASAGTEPCVSAERTLRAGNDNSTEKTPSPPGPASRW